MKSGLGSVQRGNVILVGWRRGDGEKQGSPILNKKWVQGCGKDLIDIYSYSEL